MTRRELIASSLSLAAPRPWNRPAPLGRTGLRVTPLGLSPGAHDARLILRAAEAGINYLNVFPFRKDESEFAPAAEALKSLKGRMLLGAGCGTADPAAVRGEIDRQLQVFGVERFDLWYLFSKNRPEALGDDLLAVLRAARQAGKVRACAISTHGLNAVLPRVLECRELIQAVMVTCNHAAWDDDIRRLHDAGIGVVAMKPLAGGMASVPESKRPAMLAAALRWIVANPHVDTSPASVASVKQLEENLRALARPFDEADRAMLSSAMAWLAPNYCRNCQQCAGTCGQGLPVPDILRFLMYAEGYGRVDAARQCYNDLPAKLRASRCGECSSCTVRCPNGVSVSARLAMAHRMLVTA